MPVFFSQWTAECKHYLLIPFKYFEKWKTVLYLSIFANVCIWTYDGKAVLSIYLGLVTFMSSLSDHFQIFHLLLEQAHPNALMLSICSFISVQYLVIDIHKCSTSLYGILIKCGFSERKYTHFDVSYFLQFDYFIYSNLLHFRNQCSGCTVCIALTYRHQKSIFRLS